MNNENEIEVFGGEDGDKFRVRILIDDFYDIDPRADYDNAWIFAFMDHRSYTLGDKQFSNSEDLQEYIKGKTYYPVYMYEHSGIAFSLGREYPFNCQWDSGQIGFACIDDETLDKEWGNYYPDETREQIRERAYKCLESEIKIYNAFVQGEVYCIVQEELIIKKTTFLDNTGKTVIRDFEEDEWDVTDSCGGFLGDYDYVCKEAKSWYDNCKKKAA